MTSSMSKRHRLGLTTLCLLLLGESISIVNAVTHWNSYQSYHQSSSSSSSSSIDNNSNNNNNNNNNNPSISKLENQAQDCSAQGECRLRPSSSSSSSSRPATTESSTESQAPIIPVRRKGRTNRLLKNMNQFAAECCSECTNCMTLETISQLCDVPRGGHSSVAAAATAAAEIAAETIANTPTDNALTPYGIPLNGWKVIFQAILTFINVACWLIPLKAKRISQNEQALSLANAFSGGVFLSLAFGHLIPECVHGFHGYNEATPYMLVLGGYLLIFFVEKVAFDAHGILHEAEQHTTNTNTNTNTNHQSLTTHNENGKSSPLTKTTASENIASGRGALILLGALAVHSILEMTALGLADSFGDSALLTLSIALHQPAESIALLVAFLKSGVPEADIIRFLSIFSTMGPIGVALGMAVNEFASPIVDSIMLAVVAGTFVYVGATEVIPEEFEEPNNKWKKFMALISGIVSIFAITQYTMTLEGHAH